MLQYATACSSAYFPACAQPFVSLVFASGRGSGSALASFFILPFLFLLFFFLPSVWTFSFLGFPLPPLSSYTLTLDSVSSHSHLDHFQFYSSHLRNVKCAAWVQGSKEKGERAGTEEIFPEITKKRVMLSHSLKLNLAMSFRTHLLNMQQAGARSGSATRCHSC